MKISNITIAYNLKDKSRTDDLHEEYDEIETVLALKEEIGSKGFNVNILKQDKDFPKKIYEKKPDLVVNIAEGVGSTRSRESQVPCVLESLGIPYSGSDPLSLGITLDKYLTNIILKNAGVPVPEAFVISGIEDIKKHRETFSKKEAWIVKPRWEGSSKGVFLDSVVSDEDALKKKAEKVWMLYSQPAIVEEFLSGDEITVGICGNKDPYVLGMMKISPRKPRERFVYSIEEKRNWEQGIVYEGENAVPDGVRTAIGRHAIEAFRALSLRDVARVDFRLDRSLTPRIIDINPLPGLSPRYSDLMLMSRLSQRGYSELITRIMKAVFERYNAEFPSSRYSQ